MMRRDLALRGAGLGFVAAAGAFALGSLLRGADTPWILAELLVAAIFGTLGYLAFRNPAAALRTVADAAERISEGELAQRVPDRPGPAGDLIRTFNVMAGRVESLFETVAAEHARLEAVFDASEDAMVALARDTSVRFLNPAAVSIFGADMAEAIGRSFIETARDYELDALVRRVIATPTKGETAVVTFGPERTPLRAAAVPIREGGDWAVLLMLTDLTEVQRIDQIRRDFVSNVSHELRTPLAAIRALAETLDDEVDEADRKEFLRRIHQQVERLTTLVNELLDLSRIESGSITLNPEVIHLGELVTEAASLLRTRTDAGAVTIVQDGCDLSVEGDRPSLLRVVSNLLDNAIKWSPDEGRVWVSTADEGDLVALSVRDEGVGIPEQDVSRVFERFFKSDGSRSKQGIGLGLAIVKHLVRAHGGTATVESKPGQGATFTVRLPKRFVGRSR